MNVSHSVRAALRMIAGLCGCLCLGLGLTAAVHASPAPAFAGALTTLPDRSGVPEGGATSDGGGNRMEKLFPHESGEGSDLCTGDLGWCAALVGQEGDDPFIAIREGNGETVRVDLARQPDAGGFDEAAVVIWPFVIRLAGGGALVGVVQRQSTMYSGGGASASTLSLYRLARGEPAAAVLALPWDGSSMIRACFSEKDFRDRKGACHDEYRYEAALRLEPDGMPGQPVLRYLTEATSFPGHVSRNADSLSAGPLRRRDLVHVQDPQCSITRLFRLDPANKVYLPDTALPDCGDYTGL